MDLRKDLQLLSSPPSLPALVWTGAISCVFLPSLGLPRDGNCLLACQILLQTTSVPAQGHVIQLSIPSVQSHVCHVGSTH